ncbi:Uncharacterised protein [Clostridium sporogenes]|nr:Uncharacterised protein [Clostridium sporogenes]
MPISPGEAEAVHQHADRADDARLVDEDLVGRGRDVIAARCAHVGHDDVQRLVRILLAQPPDLVVDHAGLHRAAARAVDPQHDADRAVVVERSVERGVDVVGVRVDACRDLAVDRHERRMPPARRELRIAREIDQREREQHEHGEKREAEEDLPAPCGTLLLDGRERDPLERCALPGRFTAVGTGGGIRGIRLVGHAVVSSVGRGGRGGMQVRIGHPEYRTAVGRVALVDLDRPQAAAAARATDALAGIRRVDRAVRRAHQIEARRLEELPFGQSSSIGTCAQRFR